jgi:diguanylate cyclase (GGDEF)-like protein
MLAIALGRSAVATSTVMALTSGALFLVSGSLGFLLATQMPGGPGDLSLVYGIAIAAVLIGIGMMAWGYRLRPVHHHILAVGGTVMLTIVIYEATSPVAAVALASLYISVAIDTCVFFTWIQASAHLLFAVTCCMTVLALRPGSAWWSGTVAAGATVGVGIVVGLLSRFASDAEVDALTGLPNRRGFDRALVLGIAAAARGGSGLSLVVLNLDRFHTINDLHGYRAGDEVLHQTVRSWLPLLGPRDTLARHGGDMFAVLLPETTEASALALTERLRAQIPMGSSAGVTSWQPGESASFFLSRADVALYRAKVSGGNRVVLEPSGTPPLAIELAAAIAVGEVEVLYQPIVNLDEGDIVVGLEALVRWQPPNRPDVTAAEVVRVAEESGLIDELDRYVLHRACQDAHTMQRVGLALHVNVSGLELAAPHYVTRVDEVLQSTGWPPAQLVLEVTESVLDVDSPAATSALHGLRARGIRIAIDDFGTGYSSLSRIQNLPADLLKLDRSFAHTITDDVPAPPLLQAIVSLGVALRLPVVVEGVESEVQAQAVRSMGFTLAQGFYYGRPRPAEAFLAAPAGNPMVDARERPRADGSGVGGQIDTRNALRNQPE